MIPLLSLKNVSITLPSIEKPIINKLSLEIFLGDFLIILGSNGSGKSSLIKLINGSKQLSQGEIYLQGKNYQSLSFKQISSQVATLTQDLNFSTFKSLTILENCLLAIKKTYSKDYNKNAILTHLQYFHPKFPQKLHDPVASLSGGERQTLALAMCLLFSPTLLLLDEHTSALDPIMTEEIMKLTLKFVKKKKITTLMTTHNLNHAQNYGNRLIAIQNGIKIFETSKNEKEQLSQKDLLHICYK